MFKPPEGFDPHSELENKPSVLLLETPDIEAIARAIWQRQHDALEARSNAHSWRDKALPAKFWDEFLLDARAVLSLLQKQHAEFRQKGARHQFAFDTYEVDYQRG